ncbi:hypothetical protein VCHA31O73_360053 [Vibrio chagasii]|nr:hypothetical protein VCHA31O73_360053 [Vibrio chagasii]
MAKVSSVNVSLVANTAVYVRELLTAQEETKKRLNAMESDYRRSTRSINASTGSLKQTTKEAGKSSDAMTGLGRNAGQAGIQIQQFVGQIQGGQSAMLAFSQQSADLGIVLGAPLVGAILGISASIAGILMPELFKTTNAVEKLEEAQKALNIVFVDGTGNTRDLTAEMKELYEVDSKLAELKMAIALDEANEMAGKVKETLRDLDIGKSLREAGQGARWFASKQEAYEEDIKNLAEQYGISYGDMLKVQQAYIKYLNLEGSPTGFRDVLEEVIENSEGATNEFKKFTESVYEGKNAIDATKESVEAITEALGKDTDQVLIDEALKSEGEALANALRDTNHQMAVISAEGDEERLKLRHKRELEAIEATFSVEARKTREYFELRQAVLKRQGKEETDLSVQMEKARQERLKQVKLESLKDEIAAAKSVKSIFDPESYDEVARLQKEQFDLEMEALQQKLDQGLLLEEEYLLERERLYKAHGDQLMANEMDLYNGIKSIAKSMGANYLQVSDDLAKASDGEASAIKRNFLLKQTGAAAEATVDYFASLMAADYAYASLGIPGVPLAAAAKAKSTATYAASMAGIGAATLGGIAAFNVGSEFIPNDQMAFVHKAERIIQPNINADLTSFLDAQKGGEEIEPTQVVQNNTFSGVYDRSQLQTMLAKESETIAGIVVREQKRRPNQRRS